MWSKLTLLLVIFGIQTHLVHSEATNYEDTDSNQDNGFSELRRTLGGFPEARAKSMQCPAVVPCHLLAEPLKIIRAVLNELETATTTYCRNQPGLLRFQPPPFPTFPKFPIDFVPLPQFPQSIDNMAYSNQPLYQTPGLGYDTDQQKPNPAEQNSYHSNPMKPPANADSWSQGMYTGSQLQLQKKIKVKTCNSKRSSSGKKKHAAAMAQLRKSSEDERDKATMEVKGARAEDKIQRSLAAAMALPETDSGQELLANGEKQEKVDQTK